MKTKIAAVFSFCFIAVFAAQVTGQPVINVSPDSLSDSLFTGDTSTHIVNLSNTGGSDLHWSAAVQFGTSPNGQPSDSGESIQSLGWNSDFDPSSEQQATSEILTQTSTCYSISLQFSSPTFSPRGLTYFQNHLWLCDDQNLIYKIEPSTGIAVDTFSAPLGDFGFGMTHDATHLWWAGGFQNLLYRLDPVTLVAVDTVHISTPNGVFDIAWDGQDLWANGANRSEIYRIDPVTGQILETRSTPGSRPFGLTYAAGRLYIGDAVSNAIYVIDASTGTLIETCSAPGSYPTGLAYDGRSIWNSDFNTDFISELDFGLLSWLTVTPTLGTVQPDSGFDLQVTLDATGLIGGDYTADILISSNDPLTPVDTIEAFLHVTGAPDIAVSPDSLDYGSLFIGASATDTVVVKNIGTDLLVVSNVSSDNADFVPDTTSFTLSPGEEIEILITFTPSVAAPIAGLLTITSNDPDMPSVTVVLRGQGLIPPDITVSPDSLDEDLFTGESSIQQLTISNTAGGSDLLWEITTAFAGMTTSVISSPIFGSQANEPNNKDTTETSLERPNSAEIYTFEVAGGIDSTTPPSAATNPTSLETILDSLNSGFTAVTGIIPNRYDFSNGVFGTSISDGGNDMYDGGNFLSTDLGGPLSYSDNVILNSAFFGSGGRYFTRKYPGLFVMAADIQGLNFFQITGNLGADGGGNVDGAILETTLNGITYRGFVKRVYDAFNDPSVNHLIIIEEDPSVTHEFSTNTDNDYHRVFNLTGVTRIYYLLYAGANGFYIDNNVTLNIMNTFINTLGLLPAWVSASPNSGTIPAGNTQIVDVTFDATGLNGGDYFADILISSNDPDEPEVRVPVLLHVTGAPDIVVAPDSLDYGTLFIGASATDTVVVKNTGTDLLVVSNVSSNNADFVPDTNSFDLNPGEETEIVITFAPSVGAPIAGLLTITSNDPDMPSVTVVLQGQGLIPPVIDIDPVSITANLLLTVNPEQEDTLTISNRGGSDLNWQIFLSLDNASNQILYTLNIPASTNDPSNFEETSVFQEFILSNARPFAISEYLDDLTGVNVLFDEYHLGFGLSANWSTLISDLQTRGAIVTVNSSPITSTVLQDMDVVWALDMHSALWTTPEINALNNWLVAGGGLLIESDQYVTQYNTILTTLGSGILYSSGGAVGITTSISPHQTTIGVDSIYLGGPLAQLSTVSSPAVLLINDFLGTANTAYSRVGTGRIVVMADENFGNFSIGIADNQLFGNQVFDWLAFNIDWISVSSQSGTTVAGSSTSLLVTIDGTGLQSGDYSAILSIESNDPITPKVELPVDIHVLEFLCGDANSDGVVDQFDLEYLFQTYFYNGPATISANSTDLNCNNKIDLADIIILSKYLNGSITIDCCNGSLFSKQSVSLEIKMRQQSSSLLK